MKKKSGGGEGGGANWMDTYGDMVTLLLCFFVLLYSMSTIDTEKFKAMAMSFNPNAVLTPTEPDIGTDAGPVQDTDLDGNMGDQEQKEKEQEEIDAAMDQLYQMMKEYIDKSGKNVEITKGDGGVFLSFADAVFFDADLYELRPEGKKMLDDLAPMLNQVKDQVDEIRIMGHTSQATALEPNEPVGDRMLASQRAAQVTAYLQERLEIDPGRMVSQGYGQHRPVADNTVEETRKKNRRVEMVITGRDLMNDLGDVLEQYKTLRTDGPTKTSATPEPAEASAAPSSSQTQSNTSSTASKAESGETSREG